MEYLCNVLITAPITVVKSSVSRAIDLLFKLFSSILNFTILMPAICVQCHGEPDDCEPDVCEALKVNVPRMYMKRLLRRPTFSFVCLR